jgi:hypothetical protein
MTTLSTVLRYELLGLLIALIAIITYRLLTNQINTKGLLFDKTSGRNFSPGRLQMLVVTIAIAFYYLLKVMERKGTGTLPDMPNEFLMALGGSHVIYLTGKLYGLLAAKLGFASPELLQRLEPPPPKNGESR